MGDAWAYPTAQRAAAACLLILGGTILGIAGTDLVLPAVPSLPAALGGDEAQAQLVLAAFVAGTAFGLIAYGNLGARFDQRHILIGSLLIYAAVSAAAARAPSLSWLITLRLLQGAAGSAAAVFAPGMIRRLYAGRRAISAMGVLGSVESVVPAFAPVLGAWLVTRYGWPAAFDVIAVLSLLLVVVLWMFRGLLPPGTTHRHGHGGYRSLLVDKVFLRYAISHACTLGGLLVFVFGTPTVFVVALRGTLDDFIIMQICGIGAFVIAANMTSRLSARFGTERMISVGSVFAVIGALAILSYAIGDGSDPLVVAGLFTVINASLGLRGPPGFHHAVVAAKGDDARGAALVILAILGVAAGGTAAVAPFITQGLIPLAAAVVVVTAAGCVALFTLPRLPDT